MAIRYDDPYGQGELQDQPQYQPDEWGRPWGDPNWGIPPVEAQPTTPAPGPSGGDTPEPPPAPPPAPAPNPTSPPPPTAPPITPFTQVFNPPDPIAFVNLPNAPLPQLPTRQTPPPFAFDAYTPAQPFAYDAWTPPSVEQALLDPSYGFRLQQGQQGLQNWAAARGTLNDSGTANALMEHNQNLASQEYSNIWNRSLEGYRSNRANAFDAYNVNEANRAAAYNANRANALEAYNTNYKTQFEDPWLAEYRTGIDTWIPQMEHWREGVRVGESQTQLNADQAWRTFLNQWDQWRDKRDTAILLAGQ